MKMISIDYHEKVAVVRLNHGITNSLNLELVIELNEILQSIKDNSEVRGLVLGSANDKFFSIGFDIPQLLTLCRKDFELFYRSFNRVCLDLYTFPKPTVAAITGHAIAGGCILALCCDYRLIAEGRKLMGLNEIKLGVPVPYPADCMLRNLVGVRNARDIMEIGEFYPPEDLMQIGMVDVVLSLEQVIPESIEKAKTLGSLPQKAFGKIKRNRIDVVQKQILEKLEEKEQIFLDCWYSDESRVLLNEAAEKF